MTNANNTPDPSQVVTISPNTALPKGQNGQVITTNGNWVTIPVNTSGGTCTIPPGQNYTIVIGGGGGGSGQISFDDIDLAVPVVEKKKDSDGCTCKKCKEYYQYAEPNQDDGTLICYGCRMVW